MNVPSGAAPRTCPSCGQPLEAGAACYVCILQRAVAEAQNPTSLPASSSATTPFPEFASVADFGDYQLHERLGEGAMGVVFRATKRSLKKTVALKFVKAGQNASARDRILFVREAELASRLEHPNIIAVSEVGEHEGRPFLVMRYVDGRPLSERLFDPGFLRSPRERVRLLAIMARAVHHAHQRGVIHRDLKPGNVLIDGEGVPYVTDFGLARWASHQSTVTFSDGQALGTPAFMPPEQARGKRIDLTTSGDVWSLGVILHHLVSGRLPFEADTMPGVVQLILHEDPPPLFAGADTRPPLPGQARPPAPDLAELSTGARRDLESINLRCLEKDPARRYPSAAAFAEDLERWLEGSPVLARPVSNRERWLRWIRRHPAATGAVAASLVAVAAVTWSFWQRGVSARTEELGRLFNYVADMNLAQRGLQESNHVLFARALSATAPAPGRPDLRGIEWGLLRSLQNAVTVPPWFDAREPLVEVTTDVRLGRVGAIGTHHAFVLDPAGAPLRRWTLDPTNATGTIAFSHDPDLLALGSSTGLELVSLSTDRRTMLVTGSVSHLEFSPDGRHLAATLDAPPTDFSNELILVEVATGKVRRQWPIHTIALQWTADGSLRFANGRAQVRELPADLGEPRVLSPESYRSPSGSLSPSGRFLLRTSIYGVVHLLDLTSGSVLHTLRSLPGESVSSAFSPDDRAVAVTGLDATVQVLPVLSAAGEEPTPAKSVAPGHSGAISALAFVDGHRAVVTASRDGTLRRLNLEGSSSPAYLHVEHHLAGPAGVAPSFSRDSRRVALLDRRSFANPPEDSVSLIWDTVERRPVGSLPSEVIGWGPENQALTWARDGHLGLWDVSVAERPVRLAAFRLNTNHHAQLDSQIADAGRWIVSITRDGVAQAFDVAAGRPRVLALDRLRNITRQPAPSIDYLAASPDTAFAALAVAQHGTVLWDIRKDRVHPLEDSLPADIRFSPRGRYVAVTDYANHRLRLFDGHTGARLQGISGHLGPVTSIAFTADAEQILTGGEDSTLVVWNLATGREVFRYRLEAPIYWLRASPDARWLAIGHLPTQFGSTYGSLGLGRYTLWPLPTPSATATPPSDASFVPPDSIWKRFRELARTHPL